jgi:transcriptional regulator with XRE-family HTH domain
MNLRELIDQARQPNETQKELAARLGINYKALNDAYNGKRGIPNEIALELAQILQMPLEPVIAASELITQKDETKRAKWRPYLERRAASWLCAAAIGGFMTNGQDAAACETTNVSDQSATLITSAPATETHTDYILCEVLDGAFPALVHRIIYAASENVYHSWCRCPHRSPDNK